MRELPVHVKQLITTDLKTEAFRRAARAHGDGAQTTPPKSSEPKEACPTKPVVEKEVRAPRVARDMFGRPIVKQVRKRVCDMADVPGRLVRYKYQQGITNAIRRTVRVRDLL